MAATLTAHAQDLQLNDREYFERRGVNVLVFSNSFNGGFNDEKNSGIEIIHHGVRTIQGGAVRLNNTPEQWDLVPTMTSRKVDRENGSIEVAMRYNDELARAYQFKIETNRRKAAFIQEMYHQIRTPLNIISGFAQVLAASLHGLPPDEVADITARMKESATDISRLARQLEDVAGDGSVSQPS